MIELDALDRHRWAVLRRRIQLGKRFLQRRERDHLPPRLEESLQPATEPQIAVAVELAQVSGHVPALALLLDKRRGTLVVEIAGEDDRPAHLDHAHLSRRQRMATFQIDHAYINAGEG